MNWGGGGGGRRELVRTQPYYCEMILPLYTEAIFKVKLFAMGDLLPAVFVLSATTGFPLQY